MTELKIEDHHVYLGAGELTKHLVVTGCGKGADVVFRKLIYNHTLQAWLSFTISKTCRSLVLRNAGSTGRPRTAHGLVPDCTPRPAHGLWLTGLLLALFCLKAAAADSQPLNLASRAGQEPI